MKIIFCLLFVGTGLFSGFSYAGESMSAEERKVREQIRLMDDEKPSVRNAASATLADMDQEIIVPLLRHVIMKENPNAEVRHRLVKVLKVAAPNLSWFDLMELTTQGVQASPNVTELANLMARLQENITAEERTQLDKGGSDLIYQKRQLHQGLYDQNADAIAVSLQKSTTQLESFARTLQTAINRFAQTEELEPELETPSIPGVANTAETTRFLSAAQLDKKIRSIHIPLFYGGNHYRIVVMDDGRLCVRHGNSNASAIYPEGYALDGEKGVVATVSIREKLPKFGTMPNGELVSDIEIPELSFEVIQVSPVYWKTKNFVDYKARLVGEDSYNDLRHVVANYFSNWTKKLGIKIDNQIATFVARRTISVDSK